MESCPGNALEDESIVAGTRNDFQHSRPVVFEQDILDFSDEDIQETTGPNNGRDDIGLESPDNDAPYVGSEEGDDVQTSNVSDPFSAARSAQTIMLQKRREDKQLVPLRGNPHVVHGPDDLYEVHRSTPEIWRIYLNGLFECEPDFLTSDEAKMVSSNPLRKGITSYRRLIVNENNCKDVEEIFRLMFKAKASQGFSNAGYSHFLTAVGQFVRMRCALEADTCEREMMLLELCNEGNVFKLVASLDHVELFLDYFEARSSSSATCLTKSAQILKLATAAKRFFERNGDTRTVACVERVIDKLHSSHSAYKQATRRQSRQRKSIQMRKDNNILMLPKQFLECRTTAVNKLTALMSTIRRIKIQQSKEDGERRLMRDESLMSIWCINMLAVMMVCCGGQRPQVFCQMQRPTTRELRRFQTQCKDKSYVELQTISEKTTRALDMPFVPFPASLMGVLKFHVEEVLPVLDKKRQKLPHVNPREDEFASKCLVLHSKRGLRLTTKQVTDTFRLFLFHVTPELAKMTTMNLRASYATMMLHAHRQGKIFTEQSEELFLEFLGKAMNTSVEQLKDTYACVMNEDYNSIANAITESLQKIVIEEQNNNENSNPSSSTDDTADETATVFPSTYSEFF